MHTDKNYKQFYVLVLKSKCTFYCMFVNWKWNKNVLEQVETPECPHRAPNLFVEDIVWEYKLRN